MAPVTMMMLKTVRIASKLNSTFWVDTRSTRKLMHFSNGYNDFSTYYSTPMSSMVLIFACNCSTLSK
jgi:hypothetical protein